jgi:outer membrane murein-binding lipoprotein Lpp
MNTESTKPQVRRSIVATLVFGVVLLSAGCSTTTSASRDPSEKSTTAAELHSMMQRVADESAAKAASQPAATAMTAVTDLRPNQSLATNP